MTGVTPLDQLIRESGYRKDFLSRKLGWEPYKMSRVLRNPKSEDIEPLKAILVSKLRICEEERLVTAISNTQLINIEARERAKQDLIAQIKFDERQELKRKNRMEKNNKINGKNNTRTSKQK